MGWVVNAPAALPPGKTQYPLCRRLGGPQDRSGRVRKISPPPGFDPRTVQPAENRYTDWAITAQFFSECGHTHSTHRVRYVQGQPNTVCEKWAKCRMQFRLTLILLFLSIQVYPGFKPSPNEPSSLSPRVFFTTSWGQDAKRWFSVFRVLRVAAMLIFHEDGQKQQVTGGSLLERHKQTEE
jgi:hypothetical protein